MRSYIMSLLALSLIIVSAFMHATWNYFAKQSGGGFLFVWLYMAISVVVYAPVALGVFILQESNISWIGATFILGSTFIHLIYSLTLQKGYKIGDFSLVYPIARGSGPLIVAACAFFLYDEKLTIISVIGICLIVVGIFILTGGIEAFRRLDTMLPLLYGMFIGFLIASYTLLDKGAVSIVFLSPILLNYGSNLGQFLLLTPFAVKNRKKIREEWKSNRLPIIAVGVLNPLAYILVLITMVFTPVSYVAPVRELSILIGTFMGTRLLKEGSGTHRLIAATFMFVGVFAIAIN